MADSGNSAEDPITLDEVEAIAKRRLPSNVYDFYSSGADDQVALRRNREAYNEVKVIPRVLIDVGTVDTSTRIFGWRTTMPLAFAPSAMQRLTGDEGELGNVRTAVKMGLNMTLSSQSTTSLEDVMAAAREQASGIVSPKLWFQIYLTGDWEKNVKLIQRAGDAGYEALVVTVDMPVMGNRLNERKIPVVLPAHLRLANFPVPEKRLPSANVNRQILDARTAADADAILATVRAAVHDPTLSWYLIARLRTITKMKIILKGVMAAEDARLAIEKGADAIIVSNHGGRQLDCTPATIEVLPAIAKEVKGKIPVIVDGGVRRGSDIFKAIALGADLVLVGRPVLWGLAYNGQEGVETVAHILEREFSRTMALAGVTKVEDIPKAILTYKPMARL